jgi:hypothetical protein
MYRAVKEEPPFPAQKKRASRHALQMAQKKGA